MFPITLLLLLYFGNVTGQQQPPPQQNTTLKPLPPTPTQQPTPAAAGRIKPTGKEYVEEKTYLLDWLLTGCWGKKKCNEIGEQKLYEYQGFDGWYNNVGRPELGAIDTPLLRRSPAAYKDGVYQPSGFNRPEPLELSENLLFGPSGTTSQTGKNAFLVFFGQQVVEEILDAQRPACPPEYFNIKIPEHHTYRGLHSELPILRTRYDARTGFSPNNPRQQLNEITPYLDGGLMYGTTKAWSDVLRTNEDGKIDEDGKLATSLNGLFPIKNTVRLPMANPPPPLNHDNYTTRHETEHVSRFFRLGNPRGNENPFLLTFGVLWFRWHNVIAMHLRKLHMEWTSDEIFYEARKWVIATQQHIVTNEWLKEWLGTELPAYKGYDPSIDPQIDQFFQAAAFRFGHTLVPPGVQTRDYSRNKCAPKGIIRTCNSFWRPKEAILETVNDTDENLLDEGMNRLIMGMTAQLCEKEDHRIVEDLRGNVFGPLEFSRRDLMAINIQRARDHGLPDYNTVRELFDLPRVENFSFFRYADPKIKDNFTRLYKNNFDDIDLWVGGILETNTGPGELFQKIIVDQFRRIRDGDRFWYKNKRNGLFTENQIKRIEKLSFYDVLLSVTNLRPEDIQINPFHVPYEGDEVVKRCERVYKQNMCPHSKISPKCWHIPLNVSDLSPCSSPATYDYFSTSDVSFILTFLGVSMFILGLVIMLQIMLRLRRREHRTMTRKIDAKLRESVMRGKNIDEVYTANEWISHTKPLRPILLTLNKVKKQIEVRSLRAQLIRALDLTHSQLTGIHTPTDRSFILIRVENHYDLVLKFGSEYLKDLFLRGFEQFAIAADIKREYITSPTTTMMLKHAVTKKKRQQTIERFFRVVFGQGFHIANSQDEIWEMDSKISKEVIYTELTIAEFAEALSMAPEAQFVKKMFDLVDKDKNGFISFREFMDMSVIFYNGDVNQKVKLMFDMYDINGSGSLTRKEFFDMFRSFMEIVNADVKEEELSLAIEEMTRAAGLSNKKDIRFEDFQRLLGDYKSRLCIEFNLPGSSTTKQTFVSQAQRVVESMYGDPREISSRVQGNLHREQDQTDRDDVIAKDEELLLAKNQIKRYWYPTTKYIADKQLEIFWVFLYTSVLIAIFAERAYYYHVEREHSGLRRIAGAGVTITRGAASAMMFTYSTLLLTMCQNTITILRETLLQYYVPFDSSLDMHKYTACWALFFTVMHVLGHALNFYHISTQTSDDLTCLFPNFFHGTHEIPKFHYWCWQTMTGVTGIALTVLAATIFLFSHSLVRKKFYNLFRYAHSMYPIFFILMILHGTGRLIQQPFTHLFLSGPAILFTIDKIITMTRKTIEIQIVEAECLPSGVTCLKFRKPPNFQYKSGQWVRIACSDFNPNEYHPFTLSSAPNESYLTVHIRAVGPWTTEIRLRVDPTLISDPILPTIRVDGPYGEAAQDWYKYDLAIMVGSGIGVTPFASILKDIVYKSNLQQSVGCKKVYFLWVTKTQKQFEWMVDILRELEAADENNVVISHIFITQFYQKFDLRTIFLYMCERHFQKVANKSLFTGLTAVTHFGRPNFLQFFRSICQLNTSTPRVGVFSCGSRSVTQAVNQACHTLNQEATNDTLFKHHYKSF
ncbi:dual oxidase-like isoform X2 [Athalia rosae]|uniref:dual oxidase-like isoform X2 n=1 Tax=Athalia rosae TaxID=37344 RepID=UPI00203376DB|nr:dual oxidase-like isoform X2 [Athalia rosae]